jgi:hypothetical protein
MGLAFSPDDLILLTTAEGQIKMWDVKVRLDPISSPSLLRRSFIMLKSSFSD